jgi:glutamate synthase (NADPH/NADH) large chain/glutamate synthase (ferredoxin)
VKAEGQRVVGWRDVPVDKDYVGITANWFAPYIKHLVVAAEGPLAADRDAFERKLYVIRRVAEIAAGPELVIPSFSSRTLVYKGMLTAPQVMGYFPDLQDQRAKSALALVHSRFSTNTFPSWELAHPYRMIAHNGEINTLRGNVNWMRARESQLASELFGDDLPKVLPVVRPGGSDSATFDNVLELLTLAGRTLPHAVMMMVPEAYQGRDDLPEDLKAFYAFHSCLMEPWDGPAAIIRHGETGWLVEPDDVVSLANALVEAVNRPVERRRRGERAVEDAHEHYAWPALAEELAAVYDAARGAESQLLAGT